MKRMLTKKWIRKMPGITVLEVMLALAVSALIIIAVVMFYNATKTSASVSKVISDMNGIVAAADTYIAGGGAASNLTGDNAISTLQGAGLLPATLNDPWGLPYTATVTAATASTATIEIGIPGAKSGDSNCNALVSATASQSNVTPVSGGTCSFVYQL